MKIAIIARTYKAVPNDGISRFTYEVVSRIVKNNPAHHFILIFDKIPENITAFPENTEVHVLKPATRHPLLWYFWHEWLLPPLLKKTGAGMVFYPDGIMSLRTNVPGLPVIHDISFYHRPKDTPLHISIYYRYFFRKFAGKAVRIATVSEFCRDDISSYLGLDPHLIDVAYNGVSRYFTPLEKSDADGFRQKLTGGEPYFLFVSNFSPRKNIPGVIHAYNRFRERSGLGHKLVLTGGRLFLNSETDHLVKTSQWSQDIIVQGPALHENLRYLYSAALALVFVPWFEGFGIPAAEAMSCGTPVILSDRTSLPEIGGDGALYADPSDIEGICDAMIRIANDPDLHTSLSEKGINQSQKFTWDLTAEAIWDSLCKASETVNNA